VDTSCCLLTSQAYAFGATEAQTLASKPARTLCHACDSARTGASPHSYVQKNTYFDGVPDRIALNSQLKLNESMGIRKGFHPFWEIHVKKNCS